MNLYVYVGGNPVNAVDVEGLDYTKNGIIYSDCGELIGEVGLEPPDPFLDPIDWIAGVNAGRILFKGGREIPFGPNIRFAPFGNRTGNKYGRWPHYHRRGPSGPDGSPLPGQGIGRHRPWEPSRHDRKFKDRF